MKKKILKTLSCYFCLIFFFPVVLGQQTAINDQFRFIKADNSPIFGNDIILNDQALQNQRTIGICSAFNGWLFASYSYKKAIGVNVVLLKSTDGGMTWSVLMDEPVNPTNTIVKKISLTTSGNSLSNLKLFMGLVEYDTLTHEGHPFVGRYNVVPFSGEQEIIGESDHVFDLELCNDFIFPASGSNPNSFCIIYSKTGNIDTIVCRTSNNGLTFTSRHVVASTSAHFGKVKVAYGSSSTYTSGRYFAIWEETANETSPYGHVYTAHSEPDVFGSFTSPVCLDCLDPAITNLCRNPGIVCQYGVSDNDSSNFTTVALFEKFNQSLQKYDIGGFFNKQSTITNFFKPLSFSNPAHTNLQPGIAFNHGDSTFNLTWFDSTTLKLPYTTNDKNLTDPNIWQSVSSGYNDQNNLHNPEPRIFINLSSNSGGNLWIADRSDGNGEVLFDSRDHTFIGIPNNSSTLSEVNICTHPNPCKNSFVIDFEIARNAEIDISLVDYLGRAVKKIVNGSFNMGKHHIEVDISKVPSGIYFFTFISNEGSTSSKLIIVK